MSSHSPPRPRKRPARRGFSLIETMVAIGVLTIGLLGMSSMQMVAVRSNQLGNRMAVASQLARDLAENVQQWDYLDTRLTPVSTITSANAQEVKDRWDLGRGDTITLTAQKPQYSEAASDPSATSTTTLGTTYTGLPIPKDETTNLPKFRRYWTVYALDIGATGVPQGKLVQVIVRWKEAGVGMRQLTTSTFKPNPQAAFQ